jgi:flavin reductase (DIM6/NTAB) family NADH-FMN oxidoreductase RutF
MDYTEIAIERAYGLMNTGGMIWVCTKGNDGRYDVTPIAWSCPLDYEPVSRVLFVSDPAHACFANLTNRKEYAIALPTFTQRELVEKTGSVSGADTDKFDTFDIASFPARKIDVRIPDGSAAWLECRLIRTIPEGSVSIVLGEVIAASSLNNAWKERLHYVGEGVYYRPKID